MLYPPPSVVLYMFFVANVCPLYESRKAISFSLCSFAIQHLHIDSISRSNRMAKGKKSKQGNKQGHGGAPKNKYESLDDGGDNHRQQSSGGRGNNNNKRRNQSKKQHNNSNYYNTAEDVILRESIESDGSRTIIDTLPDGNCLFRSLSDQLYYDHGQAHADVRHEICNYLEAHESFFSLFLDLDDEETKGEDAADFDDYVQTMRLDGEWGGNLELVAAARLYRRRIRVFSSNMAVMDIDYDSDKPPFGPDLWVSYHGAEHYNSVRDNKRKTKPPPPQRTFVKEDVEPELLEDCPSDEATEDLTDEYNASSNPPSTASSSNTESLSSEEKPDSTTTKTDESSADQTANKPIPKKAPKGTAPCPCGSGLKYKKCCKDKDRREARRQRVLQQNGDEASDDDGDDEVVERPMEGNFRVLSI